MEDLAKTTGDTLLLLHLMKWANAVVSSDGEEGVKAMTKAK